jgi:maleate isomerase
MIRIGHITPSSNTALEPLTYAMNRSLDGTVSHHFTRLTVVALALNGASEAQFETERMVAAARLLADAPMDVIVWNGTSASWRGLEKDQALCEAIRRETGIRATTSTIAFYRAFEARGWKRIALAVPYTEDVTRQIEIEYGRQGYTVTRAACLGLAANLDIGATGAEAIRALLRDAARGKPDCIAVVCTNLAATALVGEMERELGIPIVDSIAVTFWEACRLAGLDLRIEGWGQLLGGS